MKPKDMTLGELVCEYVQLNIEYEIWSNTAPYQFDRPFPKKFAMIDELRTRLVTRLNFLEMSIPKELEWGIPKDKKKLIKNRKSYAEAVKEKIKQ